MSTIQTDGANAPDSMVPGNRWQIEWVADLQRIDRAEWNALLTGQAHDPFLDLAFFQALCDSGSASPDTGWHPQFLLVRDAEGELMAACPLYLKDHSYGEYVFDWAWADAHDRALAAHGHRYFPKLLSAIPFSPIPGGRLLVKPALDEHTQAKLHHLLLNHLAQRCEKDGLSSAHILFFPEALQRVIQTQPDWLIREGVQFHWRNRMPSPFESFEDFLASLQRDKRKKIQQERRKVREAGVSFRVQEGTNITDEDWDFFYSCYTRTYLEHGQRPYLTRDFWRRASQARPDSWVLFIAEHKEQPIAASLIAVDKTAKVAYGRYWGALASVSCLHFEACYYQSLNWCIEHQFERFEGGAQGEHKLARGLLPVSTFSAHYLRHEGLRVAVADFLRREEQGIGRYLNELDDRQPFKSGEIPSFSTGGVAPISN